jgi:hypothetical protein
VAVSVALWLLVSVPTVAVKFALLWPVVIVTLAGTVTFALLLLRDTVAFEVAAPVRNTVQVAEEFELKLVGEHESVLNCAGATKLKELVKDAPPALAVTVAV